MIRCKLMEDTSQKAGTQVKSAIETKAEKIAEELKVSLPASGSPLLIRLIALFTLIGGLSIIGSIFADIVRPPSNTPHFYFIRIMVGLIAIIIAYEIIERSKLALWLYAVIVLAGLFINPIVSILPGVVLGYLFIKRSYFKPSVIDHFINKLFGSKNSHQEIK